MRSALGQVQERAPIPQTMPGNGGSITVKEIPYDYVATFALQGKRSNRVLDVINISTDGAFVAVSIGYSFISALTKHLTIPEVIFHGGIQWKLSTLASPLQKSPSTLDGIDVEFLAATGEKVPPPEDRLVNPVALLQCLLIRTCGIDFKYSIVDS